MMKICRLLYICCLWGVFSLSYGQHKTDWSRERLQKAIKTLRIKGYHVIENGSMAQKGALIAEMNLEKTFDSQGNIILEIYFDDKNAETLRYEYVYNAQGVKKYKLHLNPKKEKVGLTLFNCDAQGNVTKEETYDQNGDLEYSALFVYNDKGLAKESNFLREDFSMKIHSSYDSKGRLLEQEQHIVDKGENIFNKGKYRYNGHGDYDRILSLLNKNFAQKNTFHYKYDKNGNWIERFEYQDGKPKTIIERHIEYF